MRSPQPLNANFFAEEVLVRGPDMIPVVMGGRFIKPRQELVVRLSPDAVAIRDGGWDRRGFRKLKR